MKHLIIACGLMLSANVLFAQNSDQDKDQNPRFRESQNKYMAIADSVVKEHATTIQNTYKAIDYLEDKRAERTQRRLARIENRRYNNYYSGGYYDNSYYNNGYYNNGFYPSGFYPSINLGWHNGWRNNFPLSLGLNWWLH